MKTKLINLTLINIRAPTEDKEQEEKENFYAQSIWYGSKQLYHIVLGDTKAKIGQEREYYTITEQHSLQNTSSENGKPLIDFAQAKNMVIRTTEFLQKDAQAHLGIPRWTSKEPDWSYNNGQETGHKHHIRKDL